MLLSRKHQILCVEDNEDTSYLITAMLFFDEQNCDVTCIANPQQAYLLATRQQFDLFILDYDLPGISGLELCRMLRENDKKTPIIFFTGINDPDNKEKAVEAGANAFLIKSIDLDNFTSTVEEFLGK